MEFKFITGLRKNSNLLLLVDKNQLFLKNRVSESKKKTYFKCYEYKRKGCQVNLCVEDGKCFYSSELATDHNHSDQKQFIQELAVRNGIKARCAEISASINSPHAVANVRSIFNSAISR